MSLTTSWTPYFDGPVRMRGRAYHNEGRVEPAPPQAGELFRAAVQGRETYTVAFKGDGSPQSVSCTCSHFTDGFYCKHVWATLLYLEESAGLGADDPDDFVADAAAPAMPKARKRSRERAAAQPADPAWMSRLALLRTPRYAIEADAARPAPDLRQVCYVIDIEHCRELNALVVDLYYRQPMRHGWSKLKRLKLNHVTAMQLCETDDQELCAMLLGSGDADTFDGQQSVEYAPRRHRFRVAHGGWHVLMQRMIATGRCFLRNDLGEERPLVWDGDDTCEPWSLWMTGQKQSDPGDEADWSLLVTVELRRDNDQPLPIDEPALLLGGPNGLVFYSGKVAPLDDRGAFRWITHFRDEMQKFGEATPLEVALDDVQRFLDRLYLQPDLPDIDLPDDIGLPERQVMPIPHLEMISPKGGTRKNVSGRAWFTYDEHTVAPGTTGHFITVTEEDGHTVLIRRDHRREEQFQLDLLRAGFHFGTGQDSEQLQLPTKQTLPVIGQLIGQGWQVVADQRVVRQSSTPALSITTGLDWFEMRGTVTYQTETGDQSVDLPTILKAAREGRATIKLDDGSDGLLPQHWLEQHGLLAAVGKLQSDHLRFRSSQAVLIEALLGQQAQVDMDAEFAAARQKLREFDGIQQAPPAETFVGELRPYQQDGLGWMAFLDWFDMGGILADDMGLGKTIQVLALLDKYYGGGERHEGTEARRHEGEQKNEAGKPGQSSEAAASRVDDENKRHPSLIVVPRSVIFNWIDEAARFTPHLRVQAYAGADRHEMRDNFADHDIIVTSYGLMRRDVEELSKHRFHYVVLDEAQAIKNPNSQSARAARLLNTDNRLALTGTPVENHIGDLWSIFEFLNPGMLGADARFADLLRRGAAGGAGAPAMAGPNGGRGNGRQNAETVGQIARALRPFILRRTKAQVLSDLPPKTEQTIHCQMEAVQRQTYDELRQYYRKTLLNQAGNAGGGGGDLVLQAGRSKGGAAMPMMVLEALLRLRQAACHPGLIDPRRVDEPSAKLQVLLDRLGDLVEEGHKALVFSQFTSMLAIVRKQLDARGLRYGYLDGQTRNRKRVVDHFQNDPDCKAFLISLKAGGVGLNLTAAEYVFILDPWWNPAVEAQAIDRTHRIGQTQHVFAYKLICEDTVEQRILELQERKRLLADAIVGGQDNLLRTLTREDLEQLLS